MSNIHIIVKHHEGGFFSNFNKVTTFLKDNPTVGKITWDLQGQPYGAFAYNCGEVFGKLFNTFDNKRDITDTVLLGEYEQQEFTGNRVNAYYTSSDNDWRFELNKTLSFFIPTTELKALSGALDKSFSKLKNKKLIGILKRNERLKCEQTSGELPNIDTYFDIIDKHFDDNTYLCLSVDNITDLNKFIKRYKRCIYNPHMKRTNCNTDEEPHFQPGSAANAMYTYLDVIMLSKCQQLVHPISNMATASLYFNPTQTSIYI